MKTLTKFQSILLYTFVGMITIPAILFAVATLSWGKKEGRGSAPRTPTPELAYRWTHIAGKEKEVRLYRLDYDGQSFLLTMTQTNHTMVPLK